MNQPIPLVKRYMTPLPYTIGADESLLAAHRLLRKHHIRHLPVVGRDGKLVGIVSERDLHLIETLKGVEQEQVTVDEVMTPKPYVTHPGTGMHVVAAEMATHKYGAAVVMEGEQIVGILTAVDALAAFADVLQEQHAHA